MLALKKRLVAVSLVFGLTLCTGVNSVNAEVRGRLQQNNYYAVDLCKTDTVDDVREALKNQVENITIYLCGDDRNEVADIANAPFELFDLAAQHYDDVLLFNIRKYKYKVYNNTIEYKDIKYSMTQEQQEYVDNKVSRIIDKLGIRNSSDLKKVKAIHDWECNNLKYDYNNMEVNNAYSGLSSGKTMCVGFAEIFYKMALEAGLDAHIVSNEDHAWNVVQVDGKWYDIDTTYDAGENSYNYFLVKEIPNRGYDDTTKNRLEHYGIKLEKTGYLRLNKENIELQVGDKATLKISGFSNKPRTVTSNGFGIEINSAATIKDIRPKFKTSSSKIKVNKYGVITAKKKGTAKVNVSLGTQKFICTVIVK